MSCADLKKLLKVSDKDDCFSNSSSAREKGKKFVFNNRERKSICRVKVDDCLISNTNVKKCDYLFSVHENDRYYLIELKGLDIMVAIKQILSTYNIVNKQLKKEPENYKGIIVSSVVPISTQQKFRYLQEKYLRENKLRIVKTHIHHIETV